MISPPAETRRLGCSMPAECRLNEDHNDVAAELGWRCSSVITRRGGTSVAIGFGPP